MLLLMPPQNQGQCRITCKPVLLSGRAVQQSSSQLRMVHSQWGTSEALYIYFLLPGRAAKATSLPARLWQPMGVMSSRTSFALFFVKDVNVLQTSYIRPLGSTFATNIARIV